MTAPDSADFDAADTVSASSKPDQSRDMIEQAARAIHDTACGCDDPHPCDYAAAHALADAHLLADTAGRDEEGLQTRLDISVIAAKTFRARAERAEAEVARLNDALTARSAALNARIDSADKIAKDVMWERDQFRKANEALSTEVADLRATVARVRALADKYREFSGFNITARDAEKQLRAALDGAGEPDGE